MFIILSQFTGPLYTAFYWTNPINSAFHLIFSLLYHSTFSSHEYFYIGVHHTAPRGNTIKVVFNFQITSCQFWNESTELWDGTGCRPVINVTSQENDITLLLTSRQSLVTCTCNHLTSFGAGLRIVPNKLDFTVLRVGYFIIFCLDRNSKAVYKIMC